MELITILPSESRLWDQVWRLYVDSFPDYERRRISSHVRATEDPEFHTCIAIDNGNLLALLFYWKQAETIYVEHIAVNPEMRGRSIGTSLLGDFLRQNEGCEIILEIDPPVDEISEKRLRFYQKLGFNLNEYDYTHPSYTKNGHGHELKILSYPTMLEQERFDNFKRLVTEKVLKYID